MQTTRILLDQSEIPTSRYKVAADPANPPAPVSSHAIRTAIANSRAGLPGI